MADTAILPAEDNPNDVELTLRAFTKHRVSNRTVVAHDGLEASGYFSSTGPRQDAGRGTPGLVESVRISAS